MPMPIRIILNMNSPAFCEHEDKKQIVKPVLLDYYYEGFTTLVDLAVKFPNYYVRCFEFLLVLIVEEHWYVLRYGII